jgi:uncharacterized protein (DUF2336 family)
MTGVSHLLKDLEGALGRGSADDRAQTLTRLTDLFVATAGGLNDDQVGVFDVVIGRLANAIEMGARADLADRLADIPNAPHGVIRQLALDELPIARPVLTRSRRLTDDDLVAIAATKGRDHMLAMTERTELSEPVTDFLVLKGDRLIQHAVASNPTARFSPRGMNLLVSRALKDEALQSALGGRSDVPTELASKLMEAAKAAAHQRLSAGLPASEAAAVTSAIERSATSVARSQDIQQEVGRFGTALATVREMHDAGKLDEVAIATLAGAKSVEEIICAVALMAKLPLAGAERVILGSDRDSSLIVAKAMGWSWPTVKALLCLRPAEECAPHILDRAHQSFENLALGTAQRVMRFVQIREQAQAQTPQGQTPQGPG